MLKTSLESKLDIPHWRAVTYKEYLDPGIFDLTVFNAFKCKIFADFQNVKYAKSLHFIRGA